MAPYLATVAFADFRLRRDEVDGIPSWTAVDADLYRDQGALIRRGIRSLAEIVRFGAGSTAPIPSTPSAPPSPTAAPTRWRPRPGPPIRAPRAATSSSTSSPTSGSGTRPAFAAGPTSG